MTPPLELSFWLWNHLNIKINWSKRDPTVHVSWRAAPLDLLWRRYFSSSMTNGSMWGRRMPSTTTWLIEVYDAFSWMGDTYRLNVFFGRSLIFLKRVARLTRIPVIGTHWEKLFASMAASCEVGNNIAMFNWLEYQNFNYRLFSDLHNYRAGLTLSATLHRVVSKTTIFVWCRICRYKGLETRDSCREVWRYFGERLIER